MNPKKLADYIIYIVPLVIAGLVLATPLSITAPTLLAQDETADVSQAQGYIYRVLRGDNWDTVAQRTGVLAVTLQAANPQAIRANLWLRVGDRLFVPTDSAADGSVNEHTVGYGESWSIIAAKYDIPIRLLQAANFDLVRQDLVLYQDEVLVIPPALELPVEEDEAEDDAQEAEQNEGEATTVDTTSVDTASTSTTTTTITATQSSPKEPSVAILDQEAAASAQQTNTDAAQTSVTETTTQTAQTTAATTSVSTTVSTTVSSAVTTTTSSTTTATVVPATIASEQNEQKEDEVSLDQCPTDFGDYPAPIELALTGPDGNVQVLRDFLASCWAEVLFQIADWTGDEVDDLLVIYQNPNQLSAFAENDLMIFNGVAAEQEDAEGDASADESKSGYELAYRARSASTVNLLTVEDINADDQTDIVWLETTCGASTCFSTVNIRSWDGEAWANWTDSPITMAYADVSRQELEGQSGQTEFILRGGLNGSAGAGPQRMRTEVWRSVDGAPFSLASRKYDESPCLYFAILDANEALELGTPEGLAAAAVIYTRAAEENSLVSCDWRENEEAELRSFAYYRAAVMAAYQGEPETAEGHVVALETTYADSPYAQVARMWLDGFEATNDGEAACQAVERFIEKNPETWESLADYGYSNPTFSQEDVCPQIDLRTAVLQIVKAGAEAEEKADAADAEAAIEEAPTPEAEPTETGTIEATEAANESAASAEDDAASDIDAAEDNAENDAAADLPDAGDGTDESDAQSDDAESSDAESGSAEATISVPLTDTIMSLAIMSQTAITQSQTVTGTGGTATDQEADTGDAQEEAAESNEADEAESAGEESGETGSGAEGATEVEQEADAATTSEEEATAELVCPTTLDEYGPAGELAINATEGNFTELKEWMISCGVMTEEQGAIVVQDVSNDGFEDIILYPVTVSEAGYGPDGAQGSVLIYHQIQRENDADEIEFVLAASPDVFGEPEPLGIEDYNADGLTDIAWTVKGCYTFCVTEVQLLSWNGEYYIVNIMPGATIAEGEATFRPVTMPRNSLAQGRELVLSGGVSGTPEGGLSVPHEEVWQSIDGGPYQRVSWTYDRENEYNDCMGLRLVEADIALQTAAVNGYAQAIELYTNAINPLLKACNIYGMPQENEIIALQGLASFRLIQAQGLSSDFESADVTLDALTRGQPDGVFTAIAKKWLGDYRVNEDPAAACAVIQPQIDENDLIWQITDHYGYNHPALAPEQICYQPTS